MLYKYLSGAYAKEMIEKGLLLFRNLSYFRQFEDSKRGDFYEGMHRDHPDNDITLTNLTKGFSVKGDFTVINEVSYDSIYIYCMSTIYDSILFREFNCDTCIEIADVDEFIRRIRRKVLSRPFTNAKFGLMSGNVYYYRENAPAPIDLNDPRQIPFAKDVRYQGQQEYRIAFGRGKESMKTVKAILQPSYSYSEAARQGIPNSLSIKVGKLTDIARMRSAS